MNHPTPNHYMDFTTNVLLFIVNNTAAVLYAEGQFNLGNLGIL